MDTGIDIDEEFMSSALLNDADIPPVSEGFARRCLAAVRASAPSAGPAFWRKRAFRVAALFATVASFAAAAVSARIAKTGRPRVNAAVGDVSIVGVTASSSAASGEMATSNECVVNANPCATALWKALNAGQTQMAWEWPERAKSAKLTITGVGVTAERVYGKSDAFPVWNPPVPADFNEDDVYTAKLTFYSREGGGGEEVACLVAEGIGFVHGVSGVGPQYVLDFSRGIRIAKR